MKEDLVEEEAMKEDLVDVLIVGLSALVCLLSMDGIRKFINSKPPGRRLVISYQGGKYGVLPSFMLGDFYGLS